MARTRTFGNFQNTLDPHLVDDEGNSKKQENYLDRSKANFVVPISDLILETYFN